MNETVKKCVSLALALTLALGAIYFFTGLFIPTEIYLLLACVVLLVVSYVIYRWLLKGGRARFAAL